MTKAHDGGQGFGFLESVYKKAMVIELDKINLKVEQEKPLKVYYDNQVVGGLWIDLFVEQELIVEFKSVQNLTKEHEVQLVNYLNGLQKEIGLLINFGPNGVEAKRKYGNPNKRVNSFSAYHRRIAIYPFLPERDKATKSCKSLAQTWHVKMQ